METRIEKQLQTIEALIKDKEHLAERIEDMNKAFKDSEVKNARVRDDLEDRFKRELKKEREAWMASEKVRREKWENERIREIREGTVQKLEPTIKNLILKHEAET
jgi:5-azacytidine-induced protein 1